MQFMFDTATDGAREAEALIVFLTARYGAPASSTPIASTVNPERPAYIPDNVMPFKKPTDAPIASAPATSLVQAPASDVTIPEPPSPPSVDTAQTPGTSTTLPGSGLASAPSVTTDWSLLDKFGMPWDSRIHQSGKAQKKTGEWKLQKGIEDKQPGLVEKVTAEIASQKQLNVQRVPVLIGPDAGKLLEDVPPPPPVDVPPPPASDPTPAALANELSRFGKTPLPSGAVVPPNDVPAPPVEATVTYRSLVNKIVAATKANQITAAKVSEICQQSGAPNLQALNSMAHLVPVVDAGIDLHLAGLG